MTTNNKQNNKITFGLGCFWGAQKWFDLIKGVTSTSVGYANSDVPNPTYEKVCNKESTAVEAVQVNFDPNIISLEKLIEKFLEVVDPYSLNQQGNDIGAQYRSGIYWDNNDQKLIGQKMLANLQNKNMSKKVVIELKPLNNYFLAEEYHQKYLEKNPDGYCHIKFD